MVLVRGFNSGSVDGGHGGRVVMGRFYTEVSIPGSVDGRHGGCVGSKLRFQFQGVLMADMVVVLVLHRGFNSREC